MINKHYTTCVGSCIFNLARITVFPCVFVLHLSHNNDYNYEFGTCKFIKAPIMIGLITLFSSHTLHFIIQKSLSYVKVWFSVIKTKFNGYGIILLMHIYSAYMKDMGIFPIFTAHPR